MEERERELERARERIISKKELDYTAPKKRARARRFSLFQNPFDVADNQRKKKRIQNDTDQGEQESIREKNQLLVKLVGFLDRIREDFHRGPF
jgi:hypothetical protein